MTTLPSNASANSKAAEQQVIGSMLFRPQSIESILGKLRADSFLDLYHRAAFVTLCEMYRNGTVIDHATVPVELRKSRVFDDLSGNEVAAYLAETAASVGTAANIDYHANIIAEQYRKRTVGGICTESAEHAYNGMSSVEVVSQLQSRLDEFRRDNIEATETVESLSFEDFMETNYSNHFLIQDCITAAQPGVVSAKSKSQKTTVSVDAVISMATGSPFLGHYHVPKPIKCGIISAESGGGTLQETVERIVVSKHLSDEQLLLLKENLRIAVKMPLLTMAQGRDQLERWIEQHELQCAFVDPTYKALPGIDDTQLTKMAEVLFPLSDIIERTGCSIVLNCHNKKTPKMQGGHYTPPTQDDIGGTGWQQWARFFILLNRRKEWNPDTGEHWLHFRTEGSNGFGTQYHLNVREGRRSDPGGRIWNVELVYPSEGEKRDRAEADSSDGTEQFEMDADSICETLQLHPDGLTPTALMRKSAVSERRFAKSLMYTLGQGRIAATKVQVGNHKKLYDGYRINDTQLPQLPQVEPVSTSEF